MAIFKKSIMKEIEVTCKLGKELTADEIQTAAVKALGVSPKMKSQIKYRILRRSIDARNDIIYRYRVEVGRPEETFEEYVLEDYKDVSSAEPVIIIGAGPAGYPAALTAAKLGAEVTVVEKAEAGGTKYMLVEQDNCNGEDPFACLRRSYSYLRAHGFE